MTTRQLAARLDVSQSSLSALEKSEADDRISLHSLRKAAEALDCDLQYTFVPRSSLERFVEKRAEQVACQRVNRLWHSMLLEDQAPTGEIDKNDVLKVRRNLLEKNWKQLWD
jgi:predicted DNA-binding mobile mystery protein A